MRTGRLSPDDLEPATNQATLTPEMEVCDSAGGVTYYRDGQPDQAFLIGVQDANDDGVPEPYEGLGKGKALTAGNAAGTGYVTVVYNNDPSLGGLPVSLQVIKVGCEKNQLGEDSTYRGNLLVIKSDNLFDEKLTLRHTGDFGGRPDDFEYEWYIAEVDETAVSPTRAAAELPVAASGRRSSRARAAWRPRSPSRAPTRPPSPTTGSSCATRAIRRAATNTAGARSRATHRPSPAEVRAQFAPGWIKRVTSALNPYDARVDDFVAAPVNTSVDMIRQAGRRYEGPIAMNSDPENLNKIGLIEAYQTVLNRGRILSIDSSINHQGANAALAQRHQPHRRPVHAAGQRRLRGRARPDGGAGFHQRAGDAGAGHLLLYEPVPARCFGLIDEELALLRGRDETLGGVAAGPTYNRLTWNFTNGDGEVAYVMNYNIKDVNRDGFINEADAAIMYPQGHGDAWGHFLTALQKYYELLRHPYYTWVAARRADRRGRRTGGGGLLRRAPLRHRRGRQGEDGRRDHRSDLSQELRRPQEPGVRGHPGGSIGRSAPRLGRGRLGAAHGAGRLLRLGGGERHPAAGR